MFRPAWRRVDRLEKLCAAGMINPRELRAAVAFRQIYERAHSGQLRAGNMTAVYVDKHCRRPMPGMGEAQAAALARLHVVREALGALYDLLEMVVIEEMSWTALAQRIDIDPRIARQWVAAAIAALAAL